MQLLMGQTIDYPSWVECVLTEYIWLTDRSLQATAPLANAVMECFKKQMSPKDTAIHLAELLGVQYSDALLGDDGENLSL